MNVARLKIKPYLSEFLISMYGGPVVKLPENSDILVFLHELRRKTPVQKLTEQEYNLEIEIPYQKYGKDSRYHTYLTPRAQLILQKKIHTLFTATLNDYVARKVHELGCDYTDALVLFIEEYDINSISYDGLKQKNYRDRSGKRYRRENKFRRVKKC